MSKKTDLSSNHLIFDVSKPILDLQITFTVDKNGHYSGLDLNANIRDDLNNFLCENCSDKLYLLLHSIVGSINSQISFHTGSQPQDINTYKTQTS